MDAKPPHWVQCIRLQIKGTGYLHRLQCLQYPSCVFATFRYGSDTHVTNYATNNYFARSLTRPPTQLTGKAKPEARFFAVSEVENLWDSSDDGVFAACYPLS